MKILIFSDLPAPSGFGRISTYLARFLYYRGLDVRGAGLFHTADAPNPHPFHIVPLAGRDIWQVLTQIINHGAGDGWVPDLVISIQDFPYHVSLGRDCPINWSEHKWIAITPIDGSPVFPEWEAIAKIADGMMVISRFGVEMMRRQGVQVDLCHPGVDTTEFFPPLTEERAALREQAGIPQDAWLYGMFCMNQGRKAIPNTLKAFKEFAADKKNVAIYLDMDEVSPAGWNIGQLADSIGLSRTRVLLRAQLQARLPNLRDRYAILDAHGVLAYREGFGLPLVESMACAVPTFSMDWCSGREIVGEGRGYLVNVLRDSYGEDVAQHGTWGNAQDKVPDSRHFVELLNEVYYHPEEAKAVGYRGYRWAIDQTWERMGEQVERVISRIFGPAALRRRAHIQRDVGDDKPDPEAHGQPNGDVPAGPGGDHSDGRREPGVEPEGVVSTPDQGEQERDEPGVRSELQPRGGDGGSTTDPLPEFGHHRPPGLGGGFDSGINPTPERNPGA